MKKINQDELAAKLMPLYREMFEAVDEARSDESIKFCIQWGDMFPTAQNKGIIFYGRANNGWMCHDITAEDVFDLTNPDKAFARDDQMIWVEECAGVVEGYNTRKSAFWRVIRGVAGEFYPLNELQHIAWSNLCKIAPDGSNPSDGLYNSQFDAVAKIMKAEVDFFSPRHVVLLTGDGWAMPFLKRIMDKEELPVIASATFGGAQTYEIKVYEHNGVFYYLSEHPQGKDEASHIKALITLIKAHNDHKADN